MKERKMNWRDLLSKDSQRPRKNKKIIENMKIFDEKQKYIFKDLRNEFEKDYHRVLSSPSFRRLQDKTQVFPLEKNDFIRTRLTHSIEVSSFGRSLAQSISNEIIKNKLDENFTTEDAVAVTNILATAGLLHDIGNPPFGHFGEDTIRGWFKKNLKKIIIKDENGVEKTLENILSDQMKNDFYNFEGNAQAIRVVSKLHFLIDENGMNLTYGLLNTLIKYPVDSLSINVKSGDIKDKKMGYYFAEEKIFNNIVKSTGTRDKNTNKCYRHPLTFILEAADDIAYCTADIEDAIKKGFINFEDLIGEFKEKILDYEGLYEKLIIYKEYAKKMNYDNPSLYAVQRWVINIQGLFIKDSVENFIKNYDDIMNGDYKSDLFEGTKSGKVLKILKNIAYKYVFQSKPISKMEITASNIINYLLNNFIRAVLYMDTKYENEILGIEKRYINVISETFRHIYKHYSKIYEDEINKKSISQREKEKNIYQYKLYLRLLLVTDYISGMTDSYIKTLYQELSGIN